MLILNYIFLSAEDLEDIWLKFIKAILEQIFTLPGVALAALYIVVGYIIGWISLRTVLTFEEKIDAWSKDTLLESFSDTLGTKPAKFIASLTRWLIVFIFFMGAVNVAGIPWLSEAVNSILNYLPNLLAGVFIIIVGVIIGKYIGAAVEVSLKKAGVDMAEAIGLGVRLFIYYIIIIMGLAQMKVEVEVLYIFTRGLAYGIGIGVGVGVAIAVAIALKDRIREIIEIFTKPEHERKKEESTL